VARAWRGERGEPFGPNFVLAGVLFHGELKSWSCRCFLHTKDDRVCNKTLSMGETFTPDQAKHRIMQWCVEGFAIPDVPGPKTQHTTKYFRLGRIRPDRQFDIVHASEAPLDPDPYPQIAFPGWSVDWTKGGVTRGAEVDIDGDV
jgi:hypothetical protein